MFNKKILNKIKAFAGIGLCTLAILINPCTTITSYASGSDDVAVCADIKEWYFKLENGKLYKRLYNASTGNWETDWIYVMDYDGEIYP